MNKITNNKYIIDDSYESVDGTEFKFWIKEKATGVRYLLKFQKKNYSNVYSEHFASKFIRITEGNAHVTSIVELDENFASEYPGANMIDNKICVMCKDFTQNYGELSTFAEETESKDSTSSSFSYEFSDIINDLRKYHKIDFDLIQEDFWSMYLYDSILGNTDRHAGNWGLVKTFKNGRVLSPIYDNGASLFPRADFETGNKEWFKERVFTFPNSKIMFDGVRERSNYYEVINKSDIIPKYILNKFKSWDIIEIIKEWLNENSINTEQKLFYAKIVYLRYLVIIDGKNFDECYNNLPKLEAIFEKENNKAEILSWI